MQCFVSYFAAFVDFGTLFYDLLTFSFSAFSSLGTSVPSSCTGRKKEAASGRRDQPVERRRGYTFLLTPRSASGRRVSGEDEPRLPAGDCQRISYSLSG